ncbi:MAG: ABC transporter permease [Spirochaetales bacterium]|jgi:spermidine/putrescine transport system permease protein|nr:ABC transporter permease [Spirochaetales bacterium]
MKSNYKSHRTLSFSNLCLFFTILFLFLPLFVVIIYSFNSDKGMNWSGFSLEWYKQLFTSSTTLWTAFGNSVLIALTSSLTATVLGTLASVGIKWHNFKGKKSITVVSYLPMILPEVIIGISMLIFFVAVNIPLGLFTIFIAHTTFNLPFVFMLVTSRLDEFDFSTIEAARDLGAKENQTLTKVILPSISPGIISSLLMAVTMSLEDFVITFFVSGPGSGTLPLYVYSSIRYGVSPVINALSFVMILGTMVIAFTFRKFLKLVAANT